MHLSKRRASMFRHILIFAITFFCFFSKTYSMISSSLSSSKKLQTPTRDSLLSNHYQPKIQKIRPFMLNLGRIDNHENIFSYEIRPEHFDCKENVLAQLSNKIHYLNRITGCGKEFYFSWWHNMNNPHQGFIDPHDHLKILNLVRTTGSIPQEGPIYPSLYNKIPYLKALFEKNPQLLCHYLNTFFNYFETRYKNLSTNARYQSMNYQEIHTTAHLLQYAHFGNIFIWGIIPLILNLPEEEATNLFCDVMLSPYSTHFNEQEQSIIISSILKKRGVKLCDDLQLLFDDNNQQLINLFSTILTFITSKPFLSQQFKD